MAAVRSVTMSNRNGSTDSDTYSELTRTSNLWPSSVMPGLPSHISMTLLDSTKYSVILPNETHFSTVQKSPSQESSCSSYTVVNPTSQPNARVPEGTLSRANGSVRELDTIGSSGSAVPSESDSVKHNVSSPRANRTNTQVPRPLGSPNAKAQQFLELVPGQKRTAAGFIKSSTDQAVFTRSDVGNSLRPRSNTISHVVSDNRIAELSARLRARLSYAASKVEEVWRSSNFPDNGLAQLHQNDPPIFPDLVTGHSQNGESQTLGAKATCQFLTFDDTAPLSSATFPLRPSCEAAPIPEYGISHTHTGSASPINALAFPPKQLPVPKLAPPVDIVVNPQATRRRRPNPNNTSVTFSMYRRHRRYHSQQEYTSKKLLPDSHIVLVPGTPPLRKSPHPISPQRSATGDGYLRPRTHSQNALMEQDAIQTLLFMSSPENSGYHASSRHVLHTPNSNDASLAYSEPAKMGSQNSAFQDSQEEVPSIYVHENSVLGLEAQAGDEIDRLLDQMDTDSDDERNYSSTRLQILNPSATPGNDFGIGSQIVQGTQR